MNTLPFKESNEIKSDGSSLQIQSRIIATKAKSSRLRIVYQNRACLPTIAQCKLNLTDVSFHPETPCFVVIDAHIDDNSLRNKFNLKKTEGKNKFKKNTKVNRNGSISE